MMKEEDDEKIISSGLRFIGFNDTGIIKVQRITNKNDRQEFFMKYKHWIQVPERRYKYLQINYIDGKHQNIAIKDLSKHKISVWRREITSFSLKKGVDFQ